MLVRSERIDDRRLLQASLDVLLLTVATAYADEEDVVLAPGFLERSGGTLGYPTIVGEHHVDIVRHQSYWGSERFRLREALARLVDDVTRLADDAASVGLRWSVIILCSAQVLAPGRRRTRHATPCCPRSWRPLSGRIEIKRRET